MSGRTHFRAPARVNRTTGLFGLLLFLILPLYLLGSDPGATGASASREPLATSASSVGISARSASVVAAAPAGRSSQPATLPPIPAGMPVYFDFGLFNADITDVPPAIPWDFRYQYLTGGVNTGNGWATWNNPPGQYATNYIDDARSRGMTPAFQYYQILESAPYYDEYQNMQDSSTMYDYFDDWHLLMTKCAQAGGTVVVMLEADLTGTLQQLATNDDATTVSASVASSGYPDAAGYPNNFRGMYQAMLHIRDAYASNVLVTLDISNWGPGDDIVIALRNDPNYDWQTHADRTAAFLNSLGPGFDMLSWNPSDRDAAWYQAQGSNRWWDFNNVTEPTFNTMGAWLGRIITDTNKRAVLWQVPNGNRVYRSENNSNGHWQDNRTEYFLNSTSGRQHMQEWANLGVLGIWWGAGVGSQTHYFDSNGDGTTNPQPINGNNEVALYPDDDGGYIRLQSDAYYSGGVVYLPGSNPPSPTPTVTGTPPTATRTPTRTNTPIVTPSPTVNPSATSLIYTEGLQNSWQDWSWGSSVNLQDTAYHHTGQYSLSCQYTQAWGGLQLGLNDPGLNTSAYNYLLFYVNGGANSGQQVDIYMVDGGGNQLTSVALDDYIVGGGGIGQNVWKLVSVPLADLGASNIYITAIALQDAIGSSQPRFYVDDIMLSGGPGGSGTPTSTPFATSTRTSIPLGTSTRTPTSTRTGTNTPIPTSTRTATRTPTASNTPTGTWIPPTSTNTPTRTPTAVPTHTPTNTAVPPTSTNTRTSTPTSVPTDTPTGTWVPPTATGTPTDTPTSVPTDTPTGTWVPPTATDTPVVIETATGAVPTETAPPEGTSEPPTATPTECSIDFTDVSPGDYFYQPVLYLYCDNVIGGYPDNTFRPYRTTSRAQLAKMAVLGEGWQLSNPDNNTFHDVLPGSTFYEYVETAAQHGLLSGYPCGSSAEPCDSQNRPYFRPNNNVTRAQVAKIMVLAEGWALLDPNNNTFHDVLPGSTFYLYAETAAAHGLLSGYTCGGPGEPCDSQNRPYFRPNNSAMRAHAAKIIYFAITSR